MKGRTRTRIAIAFCCAATLPLLAADGAGRLSLQRAVDEAAARGGGRVVVPAGEWVTGSIELKSGVELHLEKGAVLKGSADPADYNANDAFPENRWSDGEEWSGGHLVWGRCVTNVAITGEGTIDGNGPAFFGDCEEVARWPYYKYGLKLHPLDRTWFRPGMMVAFFRSQGVRLEDVTLANTPAWTCHFRCCDGVDIRNVTIDADRTIANSDGFSIDCTRNVRVEGCTVRTGDDGFAIRASCPLHAADSPCENIVITNCDVSSCCYGIRFGVGTGTIRNVRVENTRILEAAGAGVGFTPAWVDAKRNCHIEDVLLRGCTVSECIRPVEVVPAAGDSRVTGVRFERCVFNTLLPPRVEGGPDVSMAFADCTRNTIERFKVRHQLGWSEREIRNGRFTFAEVGGDTSKIEITDCRPKPLGDTGVLILSFDDRNFDAWEAALPVFAKYGAHVTFFVNGEFDAQAVRTAKRLMAGGHSIGLHGQHHANVPETIAAKGWAGYCRDELDTVKRQCDVAYIPVRNFAYPNGRSTDETDAQLLKLFDRVRPTSKVRPYDPKGERRAELKPLVTDERVFFPVADLPKRRVLPSVLLGEAYNTDIDDIVACVKRAGERKETLVLSSHGIWPNAPHIHMKMEWLEKILATAAESGVAVLGFDELPCDGAAVDMPGREIRIVHCGDPQLGFGPGGEAAAEAKYAEDLARFERVIAAVNELKPDLCFIAGDMTHVGERLERDWPRLAKAFKVPFVVAPGNHDLGDCVTKESVERFERVFGYSYKSLKVGDWRFICGNSQYWRPTDETDRKAKYEAWVADELKKAKAAGEKLILASHIPPFTMRSDEPDSWENCPMAIRSERVKAYLDAGARFYLAGHTHTMLARAFHGMTILNAETTCWNFDGLPFGFRVLTIRADGSYDWNFRKVE